MKDRTKDLEKRLMAAEENLHQMEHNADIAVDLEAAEAEVKMLKKQLQVDCPICNSTYCTSSRNIRTRVLMIPSLI